MVIHKASTTEKATVVRAKWNGLVMVVEGANNNEELRKMSDIIRIVLLSRSCRSSVESVRQAGDKRFCSHQHHENTTRQESFPWNDVRVDYSIDCLSYA
jgi:cytochrome c